jgi:cold-inducible RNA-binding protein
MITTVTPVVRSDAASNAPRYAGQRETDRQMARKLYVGNLPFNVDEQALRDLFAASGTVDSVNIMRDQATGRARGFAFVEMASDDEAQNAISAVNNASLGGRTLTVNEARPKTNSGGSGGGSGGYAGAGGGSGRGGRRERW